MSGDLILPILLVVANFLGAGMIIPQAVRLHRRRSTDGVSGLWIGVGASLNLWWLAYGISQDLWGLIPLSITSVTLYGLIAWLYRSILGRDAVGPLTRGAAAFAWPLAGLLVGGWAGAGVALGAAYCVQFTPAVLAAVRADSLKGLSAWTWIMAGVEGAIWFSYGAVVGDIALTIGGGGGALMSAAILARIAQLGLAKAQYPAGPVSHDQEDRSSHDQVGNGAIR